MGHVTARRGRRWYGGNTASQIVRAYVPLAEMFGYAYCPVLQLVDGTHDGI